MDILPIDFDMTIVEISKWVDQWKSERFGGESLQPERYYNITDDGRFLYGVKEGESLNDEKAICDRVLELLLKMRLINQKLSGRGLSQHLQNVEREQLKKEREGLYNEFLKLIQQPQNLTKDTTFILSVELDTEKAQKAFCNAIEKGWMKAKTNGCLEWLGIGWIGKQAQLSYLCARIYGYQYDVNRGNVGERIPYDALERLFDIKRLDRSMQQVFEAKKPQKWRVIIDKIIPNE